MTDARHTYPSKYPPGIHWAVDEAWHILDMIKPGLIPDDVRSFLAGSIAGALVKFAVEGAPKSEGEKSKVSDERVEQGHRRH